MTSIRNLYKKTNTQTGLGAGLNLGTWDNSGTFTTGTAFDGNDSKMIIPKVTTAVRTASTPLVGEIVYDTDDDLLYRGDGVTLGGVVVGGASAFADLTDVDTTGLQIGQQMKWTGTVWVPSSTREVLTADRTYYVRTDGSNSNNGLSNTAGGAFLTIQKAIDVVASLDISIYDVVIQLNDGTYSQNVTLKNVIGSGTVEIRGNIATWSNVVINSPVNRFTIFGDSFVGNYLFRGLRVSSSHVTGGAFYIRGMSSVKVGLISFITTPYHFVLEHGARVDVVDNYSISGTASTHIYVWYSASIDYTSVSGKTITLLSTPNFSSMFLDASYQGGLYVSPNNFTFSGSATGKRYGVNSNATVATFGLTLPGSIAGTTATGGQYM